ncbi:MULTISPECIES: DUF4363 family protein [Clostridium]|uniref:DUF4363 domain-containing protein n=1 Tax=Clostridium cadaveris TaxID=1529 RepID=A0A1I2KCN0_9CLOT|nr:DUF4363 family protein [Clostridium cadaveris]MDU4952117.1 DUF4363 family protein [Clostridium sp.]MDM8310566.1 DUF4363 family protein [Clostridium cadaveris]MDY4948646.1 DUF4363 family protein [Clostridium cadaveris]NME65117.1 DUF4363 family protein [Clostridium cadaveris]NWK11425.1 DUF4363 family protein [Clostridium cadaveris]
MNKSTITSCVLFLLLLISATFSSFYLHNFCVDFSNKYDELEELIVDENWDESYNYVIELLEETSKKGKLTAVIINHQEVDNLELELYTLTQYVKNKNLDLSLSTLHRMKFNLENIRKLNEFTLENIF